MVRAFLKNPTGKTQVKRASRYRRKANAQHQGTGNWLCEINGCNKRFAREADLKRHQSTAKAHRTDSEPISCPQCDSTFSRIDALRRHQKSRHNGVFSVPVHPSIKNTLDGEIEGEGAPAPQNRNHSPGRSRARRGKSSPTTLASTSVPVPTILTEPDAPGRPTGSQSYYRHDMVNAVFVPPQTPDDMVEVSDVQQPQISIPTERLHVWAPNLSWAPTKHGSIQPPSGQFPYEQPAPTNLYFSGSYYRLANGLPSMTQQTSASGNLTVPVDSAITPQLGGNSARGDSVAPLLSDFNDNIDPALQNISTTSTTTGTDAEEVGTGDKRHETDAFTRSGLSTDVQIQRVLKAVLAMDSETNTNIAITRPLEPLLEPENPETKTVPSISAAPTLDPRDSGHENESVNNNGRDAMGLGVNDKANINEGASLKGAQAQGAQTETDSLSLPDGIKELINEDSLSYASPS